MGHTDLFSVRRYSAASQTKTKIQQKKKHSYNHLGRVVNSVLQGFKSAVSKSVKLAKRATVRALEEWLQLSPSTSHPLPPPMPLTCSSGLLPPDDNNRKTVVLDLDETLIHSFAKEPSVYDFSISIRDDAENSAEERNTMYYVLKRPGLDRLLTELSHKYELVLFTASVRAYAEAVLEQIDPTRLIKYRLFRDSCKLIEGAFVKDLKILGRDLKRVIIVDDNPSAFRLQPDNAIPVNAFVDDLYDRELISIISFFNVAEAYDDLRDAIHHFISVPRSLSSLVYHSA